MRELKTEVEISAPKSIVWGILTDLASYTDWNPFIVEANGDVAEGFRLVVKISPPGGKPKAFKPTVTRVDEPFEFRWLGRLLVPGVFDGEHIFSLQSTPSGTSFVQREKFRGLLVPLLWGSIGEKTRRGFEAMNAALKTRAEKATSDGAVPHPARGSLMTSYTGSKKPGMIVQISSGAGAILSISPKGIEFRDDSGEQHLIDLSTSPKGSYVGSRGLDAPPWWVQIKRVRFIFSSYEAAYEELLMSLREFGWRTFDTT